MRLPKINKVKLIFIVIISIIFGLVISFVVAAYPIFVATCENRAISIGINVSTAEVIKVMKDYEYEDLVSIERKDTGEEFSECCEGEKKELRGHNISAMIKALNPSDDFNLKKIYLKRGGSVLPKQFNELWRYGADVNDEREEERAENTLLKIAEWIHTRL